MSRKVVDLRQLNEETLLGVLAKPFKDIFKILRLSFKETIANGLLVINSLFALSAEGYKKAYESYDGKRVTLNGDWRELKKELSVLGKYPDAELIMFLFNPAGYLGAKTGQLGVTLVGDVLSDQATGWGDKIRNAFTADKGFSAALEDPDGKTRIPAAAVGSLMSRLDRLFLKEGKIRIPLGEANGDSSGLNAAEEFIDYVGVSDPLYQKTIMKSGRQAIEIKKEFLAQLLSIHQDIKKLAILLEGESDYDEFEDLMKKLDAQGPLLAKLKELAAQIDEDAKRMAVSDKFKEKIKDERGIEDSGELYLLARDIIFDQMMKGEWAQAIQEVIDSSKEMAIKTAFQDWPSRKQLASIPQNSLVKEAISVMDSFQQSL